MNADQVIHYPAYLCNKFDEWLLLNSCPVRFFLLPVL